MELSQPRLSLVVLVCALALAGCSGGREGEQREPGGTGRPRSFAMGLSSLPAELTDESYAEAFERAAGAGEVILIRRMPPWQDLVEEGAESEAAARAAKRETELADEHGLDIFFAIDLMEDSGQGGELSGLPPDLRGSGFASDKVRRAFIAYTQYVAFNYRPRYLALGVEVNRFESQNPEDFAHFVAVYDEAYDAAKAASPETLVFPTFQLEELQGRLPGEEPQQPRWHVIQRFEPRMDLLAVSTYPGPVFADPNQMPPDYFTQLEQHTDRPIIIAEMGYASEPGPGADEEDAEARQATFLRRTLAEADRLRMPLVVWFAGQDPTFTGDPPLRLVQHIGLLRADGSRKEAWSVWVTAAQRPLAEAARTRH